MAVTAGQMLQILVLYLYDHNARHKSLALSSPRFLQVLNRTMRGAAASLSTPSPLTTAAYLLVRSHSRRVLTGVPTSAACLLRVHAGTATLAGSQSHTPRLVTCLSWFVGAYVATAKPSVVTMADMRV